MKLISIEVLNQWLSFLLNNTNIPAKVYADMLSTAQGLQDYVPPKKEEIAPVEQTEEKKKK